MRKTGVNALQQLIDPLRPRTTADLVFDKLRDEIVTLEMLPGTKISEADVARRLGVSRQPVRDAFSRLDNLELLWVRPQRATIVRGFSMDAIENARFVRQSVELEVVEQACSVWDTSRSEALDENLALQQEAIDAGRIEQFHALDYQFHQLICRLSGNPLAFEAIENSKRKVDRLCLLSLGKNEEVQTLLDDHRTIAQALCDGSIKAVRAITRTHLSRLNDTIQEIYNTHSEYFE